MHGCVCNITSEQIGSSIGLLKSDKRIYYPVAVGMGWRKKTRKNKYIYELKKNMLYIF